MIENETKGWYGSYSLAGKRSAEKFNNILRKNEILKGDNKKIKVPDMFAPDEMKYNNTEKKLDYYEIFALDAKNLKKKIKQKYNEEERSKKQKDSKKFNLFFHNRHHSSENKIIGITASEPGCTRYSPNYDYIWPKLITGIKWGDQRGRNEKKIEVDNRDFIINNLENYDKYIINSGFVKCFVNMNNLKKKKSLLNKKYKIYKIINGKPNIKGFTKNIPKSFDNAKATKTSSDFYYQNTSSNAEKLKIKDTNSIYKNSKLKTNATEEYISSNISNLNKLEFNNNFLGKTKQNFFDESKVNKSDKKNKTNAYAIQFAFSHGC